jgi:hypothetical protein
MRHEAWLILDGGERCDCALSDVSDRGARINVPDSEKIPDNFMLLLAANGAARRQCRVIWRQPRQLGVKFDTWLDERVRAAKAPKLNASADTASKESEPAESDS